MYNCWLIKLPFKTTPTPPAAATTRTATIIAPTNINLHFMITFLYTVFLLYQDSYCALK